MNITLINLADAVLPGDMLLAGEILDEINHINSRLQTSKLGGKQRLVAMYQDMLTRLESEFSLFVQEKEKDDKERLIRDLQHEIGRLNIANSQLNYQVLVIRGVKTYG